MTRLPMLGFDRRIDLEWLDAAAAKAAEGATPAELRAYLWSFLEGSVRGEKQNSARGKTVTVLMRIWGEERPESAALRRSLLALLPSVAPEDRLEMHWAMIEATYPFFREVASCIRNLIVLQGSFTLAHLERRIVSTWGQRSTVKRALQRVVRSMVQWGVLRDGDYAAGYTPTSVGMQVLGVSRRNRNAKGVGIVALGVDR